MKEIKSDVLENEIIEHDGASYTWIEFCAKGGQPTGVKTLAIIENQIRCQLDQIEPTEENLKKFREITEKVKAKSGVILKVDNYGIISEEVDCSSKVAGPKRD